MRCFKFTTRVQTWSLLLAVFFGATACGNGDANSTAPPASDPETATSPFSLYSVGSDLYSEADETTQTTETAALFPVPELTISASPGLLNFNWSAAEKSYLVRIKQTNLYKREFITLFETQNSLVNDWSFDINTPLFNWAQTRFMLEVCDADQCLYSNSIAANDYQSAVAGKLLVPDSTAGYSAGTALAITADASTLVVGAPTGGQAAQPDTGTLSLHFRVGKQWWPDARLQADGISSGALLGQSVAISDDGDTVVAGAPDNIQESAATGTAVVFERFGEGWSQTAELTPDSVAFNAFGAAIKINAAGNTVVVSAPETPLQGQSSSGAVWIYQRSNVGWQQSQKITLADATEAARFGSAIAFSSDSSTLFISDEKGGGHVHVYTLSEDQYRWVHTIGDSQLGGGTGFGDVINTNAPGTVLIAGLRSTELVNAAVQQQDSQFQQVAVFSRLDNLIWRLNQKLTPSGAQSASSRITLANSVDAGVISIGLTTPGTIANTVTTFINSSPLSATQYWRYATTLTNPEIEANGFAASLGMSADGHTLLIGAPQHSENGLSEAGGVFYYW